jgi:HPt (histidine-containing phosphotransfer) domain-containing protein
MATDAQTALAAALDRMWDEYLPLMHERVAVLETAAKDFAADKMSIEQHEAASSAAHKLAGICGTFGLTRATVLARELEIMYSRQNGPDKELAATLLSTTAELRTIIDSRK